MECTFRLWRPGQEPQGFTDYDQAIAEMRKTLNNSAFVWDEGRQVLLAGFCAGEICGRDLMKGEVERFVQLYQEHETARRLATMPEWMGLGLPRW